MDGGIIAIAIVVVALAIYLYDRRKPMPDVVALPASGLTEDMSVEPGHLDGATLESIGAPRDRSTMGAGTPSGRRGTSGTATFGMRSRSQLTGDAGTTTPLDHADTTERFGSDPTGQCRSGTALTHSSNPLIACARTPTKPGRECVARPPSKPCSYNGIYRYDEPCELYERR